MVRKGRLISAKRKFNPFMKALSIGVGFPDFIAYRRTDESIVVGKIRTDIKESMEFEVIGVEAKSNGYLDKEEKEKCNWLIDNHIFSRILIAKKSKERGKIDYAEFRNA